MFLEILLWRGRGEDRRRMSGLIDRAYLKGWNSPLNIMIRSPLMNRDLSSQVIYLLVRIVDSTRGKDE
jgi:hypothetical protein